MNQHHQPQNYNEEISSHSSQSLSELIPKQDQIKNPQKDTKIKMKSIPAKRMLKESYKNKKKSHFDQNIQQNISQSSNKSLSHSGCENFLGDLSIFNGQNLGQSKKQQSSFSFDFYSQKIQGQKQLQKESKVSSDSSKQRQEQIQDYIEQIKIIKKQMEVDNKGINNTIKNNTEFQSERERTYNLNAQLEQKNKKIEDLQKIIRTQAQLNQIQKKANQIYTQFFHDLVKIVASRNKNLKQSEYSMENILKLISETFERQSNNIRVNLPQIEKNSPKQLKQQSIIIQYETRLQQLNFIISNCDDKISQLRNELVKSTQNNINAIFNTQISASSCLQHQIKKINSQLLTLKMNINQVSYQSKQSFPNIIKMQPPSSRQKQNKIVNIYNYPQQSDSDSDTQFIQDEKRRNKSKRNYKNKINNKKKYQQAKQAYSQQQSKLQVQQIQNRKTIQLLKNSYTQIKEQYNNLFRTLKVIYKDQETHKKQFDNFNIHLLKSIKEHFERISQKYDKATQKYEQQKRSDKNIINHLNNKFTQLMSIISVPQRLQKQLRQDDADIYPCSQISLSVQCIRQMQKLEQLNIRLNQQLKQIQEQNIYLRQEIQLINSGYNKIHQRERRQSIINQLKGLTSQEILYQNTFYSQQQKKPQKYQERAVQNRKTYDDVYSLNAKQKNLPSNTLRSNHQMDLSQTNKNNYRMVLNDKNQEIKSLTEQLHYLKQLIRERQSKIHQLQILSENLQNRNNAARDLNHRNNINLSNSQFDDSKSISYSNMGPSNQKYQIYIKNLKLLLRETRKQNGNLKLQLEQLFNDQQAQCRTQSIDAMKNSAAQSDRTAKNYPSNNSPSVRKGETSIKRRTQEQEKVINQLNIYQNSGTIFNQKAIILCLETIVKLINELDFQDRQSVKQIIQNLIVILKEGNNLLWQNLYQNINIQKLMRFLQQCKINENQ